MGDKFREFVPATGVEDRRYLSGGPALLIYPRSCFTSAPYNEVYSAGN